ncbi:hypothetical protein JTB14_021049 [Gonioctena quinquepunctata]|nr:hypothetical protein JTB14_021049 [Gonioctena quinquepunctata]
MNNQDIPGCSKDSDIKIRRRKLEPSKQSELENLANNLDETSDYEDPYSNDDSVYDRAYDPEDDNQRDISDEELWASEEPPDIAFLAQPCYNVQLPDDAKPIDYFHLTFPQDILDIVVQETNRGGTVTDPATPSDYKDGTQHQLEPIPDMQKIVQL